jgi:hypothetical protein
MSLNWNSLRPWNGSQNSGFEELCCQLAEYEAPPAGSKFIRKGTPDGGVECFWILPTKGEWGWQAKFLFPRFTAGKWSQLDKSVEDSIDNHPNLIRYTVCLPFDRSDPRGKEGQKSFLDRWNDRVGRWEQYARDRGRSVEFMYWGEHEIHTRLTEKEEHAGRYKFWFDQEFLSLKWFENHIREVTANAGERYHPALNVELPIAQVFDGLGRTPKLFAHIDYLHKDIRKAFGFISSRKLEDTAPVQMLELQRRVPPLFATLGEMRNHGWNLLPFSDLGTIETKTTQQLINLLWQKEQAQKREEQSQKKDSPAQTDKVIANIQGPNLRDEIFRVDRFLEPLHRLLKFATSSQAVAANKPALLIVGEAGSGKTHLLCDIADHRTKIGQPTVLLLGQHFGDAEPWRQILDLLKLKCSPEELLGALDAAAQATETRALILIDALNEGEGQKIWNMHLAGILARLENYPRIGIALSVRNSYEKLVVPEHLAAKLVRVEHHGFEEHEYEATNRFFTSFGIEPSVPLLHPEFKSPQFLLLFCRGLKNKGLSRMPTGLHGITAIFEFFLNSVNEKLAHPEGLDFDPSERLVQKAVDEITRTMSERQVRWLSRVEVKKALDSLFPSNRYDHSLLKHLLSEGIIAEDLIYSQTSDEPEPVIRFSYERFADHCIARLMLGIHLDRNHPEDSFTSGKPLGQFFGDPFASWRNQGMIEALCIQVPEQLNRELPHLLPDPGDTTTSAIRSAFVNSLLWRSPGAFNDSTINYINNAVLRYEHSAKEFWNIVITLAPVPGHPFNANRLHKHLMKSKMPDRDAWWSTFIHRQYGAETAIDRILDWIWSPFRTEELEKDATILCATAIGWFLTSSNRFLRDHATKSLVKLIGTQADIVLALIDKFRLVDDPYVIERILAVAYGCTTKIKNSAELESIATAVYNWIFVDGKPPIHILIRDYARGVIEAAVKAGVDLTFDLTKVRPPYQSAWPRLIPSLAELEKQYGWREEKMDQAEWSRLAIYDSVMGFGDFARYVIGTNSGSFDWSNIRLGKRPKITAGEKRDKFLSTLKGKKKSAWERAEKLRWENIIIKLTNADHSPKKRTTESQQAAAKKKQVLEARRAFEKTLSPPELRQYRQYVLAYDANPRRDEHRFDLSIAQRWILTRVFDLGWTVERLGTFDRDVNLHYWRRDARKTERIGKKYQWIAYHEFLGLVSDHFEFGNYLYSDSEKQYEGPWQTYERDIDPTCALREIPGGDKCEDAWWCPRGAYKWDSEVRDSPWISSHPDLPDAKLLIDTRDPGDGSAWLVLQSYPEWKEPIPAFEEDFEKPRRRLWYQIRSIVVAEEHATEAYSWLSKQHFWGRRMPENPEHHGTFLGEFYWAPALGRHELIVTPEKHNPGPHDVPFPFAFSSVNYHSEMNSFDCSMKEAFNFFLPGALLVKEMELRWNGIEGQFFDSAGERIGFDPAVGYRGPNALLIRKDKFLEFLKDKGFEVFWFLLGAKQTIGANWNRNDWPGELQVSGTFKLKGDEVVGELRPKFVSPNDQR